MGSPLAAAVLFLVACAPCGSDFNPLSILGNTFTLISTVAKDLQAVRLNDTRVHAVHTLEFLLRQLLDTLKGALLRLPDLLHPRTYLGELLPHVVALALVAATLLPPLVFPAKVVALFLAVMSTYNPDWKVFDPNYLQNM